MSKIVKQDTNGVKALLDTGELGYDNYPTGGDAGRVYVGTGSTNIPQAKKAEVVAVDGKVDTHVARVDNPHNVTKVQVGLSNVDNTSDVNKPISTAVQAALDTKQAVLVSGTNIKTIEGQSLLGVGNIDLGKSDVGLSNVDNTSDSVKIVASASKLTTARTIGGTTFDGTSNIDLPGVNMTGNQDTSGNAATSTKLTVPRNINGVAFDGSTDIIITDDTKVARTSSVGSAVIPAGTTAQRDTTPENGWMRYNNETLGWEGYSNGVWQPIGGGQMLGQALVKAISYNAQTVAENITIPAGLNAYSVGDVTIADGFTLTVENSSVYKVL